MQIGQLYGTPTGPRNEILPSLSYGYFSDDVVAGGNVLVKHSTNAVPVSDNWVVGGRCWVSWQFFVGLAAGASLEILLTADDIAVYDSFNVYPLWGATTTWNAGIFLPCWKARFRLLNASGVADNLIQGCIKVQAVF
jgi:hypothetical protein